MKKRWVKHLSILFFSLFVFSCQIFGDAEREVNDSFEEANDAPANLLTEGSLKDSDDKDYYRISLPAKGYFSFVMNRTPGGWHYVTIYDEGYNELWESPSLSDEGKVVSPNIGMDTGNIYVAIRGSNTGKYSFTIEHTESESWETELNEGFDTPYFLDVNQKINGSLRNSDDKDVYRIEIPERGYFFFNMSRAPGSWHYVTIYDDAFNELWSSPSLSDEGNVKSPNIGMGMETIYIKISGSNTKDYSFQVEHKESDAWEMELNENYESSDFWSVNQDVNGALRTSDDKDYHKIEVPSRGYIQFIMRRSPGGWHYVELYDEDYNLLWQSPSLSDEGKIESPDIGIEAEDIYVKISGSNTKDYSFQIVHTEDLSWETEINDSYEQSNICLPNTTINGALRNSDDKDYYKFEIPSGERYRFSMQRNPGSWHYINLYDGEYNELWESPSLSDEGNIESPEISSESDILYVVVRGSNLSNYSFSVDAPGVAVETIDMSPTNIESKDGYEDKSSQSQGSLNILDRISFIEEQLNLVPEDATNLANRLSAIEEYIGLSGNENANMLDRIADIESALGVSYS